MCQRYFAKWGRWSTSDADIATCTRVIYFLFQFDVHPASVSAYLYDLGRWSMCSVMNHFCQSHRSNWLQRWNLFNYDDWRGRNVCDEDSLAYIKRCSFRRVCVQCTIRFLRRAFYRQYVGKFQIVRYAVSLNVHTDRDWRVVVSDVEYKCEGIGIYVLYSYRQRRNYWCLMAFVRTPASRIFGLRWF